MALSLCVCACVCTHLQFVGPVWLGLRTFIAPVVSLTVYLTRGLAYALQPLGTLLIALYKLLFTCGAQLGLLAKGVSSSLAVLLGPPAQLLWGMLLATAQLVRLVCQLARVVVQGPAMVLWQVVLVLQMVLMRFGSSLGVAWGVVTTWGKVRTHTHRQTHTHRHKRSKPMSQPRRCAVFVLCCP